MHCTELNRTFEQHGLDADVETEARQHELPKRDEAGVDHLCTELVGTRNDL